MLKEFFLFLKDLNVVALAIGFVMGTASTSLTKSFVNDILMPLVSPLLSSESWREATLSLGPITLAYGSFMAELLNFFLLALIIFLIAKKILKVEKKAAK